PMFEEIWQAMRMKHPRMAFDSEENGEAYADILDGFMVWRWTEPGHVPLFPSLYAGRMQFTGRLFNENTPGDEASFFAKCAEQLVNAEQIGWFRAAEIRFNGAKRLYMKKMAHLRRALLPWFNEADMLHPLSFAAGPGELTCRWGAVGTAQPVTRPRIRHSVWKRPEGVMIVFVNSANEPVAAQPVLSAAALGLACDGLALTVCREGGAVPVTVPAPTQSIQRLDLPPYASEVWLVKAAANVSNAWFDGHAQTTATAMGRIGEFTAGPPIFVMDTRDTAPREAASGRWIGMPDIVSYLGTIPSQSDYVGWMMTDGVIYFGTVDFGTSTADRRIEADLAVEPHFAGSDMGFFIDSPIDNGNRIAYFPKLESTGGGDRFVAVSAPLTAVTGRHKAFARFGTANACNFRRWRIVSAP
ncbi:MAG: hypothetical protein PHR35_16825, partial [Kiritimatiellae bacterium]|nr:hypothetical protein [Kiritimatiellia bacterium]